MDNQSSELIGATQTESTPRVPECSLFSRLLWCFIDDIITVPTCVQRLLAPCGHKTVSFTHFYTPTNFGHMRQIDKDGTLSQEQTVTPLEKAPTIHS